MSNNLNLAFYAVNSLPQTLIANALYYVANGDYAESYVTDKNGVAKMVGNSTMINTLISQQLANWTGAANQVTVVADLAARDALVSGATTNLMVTVVDASDDPTVDAGAALYSYEVATSTWYKLSEYESMDVVVTWNAISGKPTSSAAQIDSAVSQTHTHANKAALDKVGEDANGDLTYNGSSVRTKWSEKNW